MTQLASNLSQFNLSPSDVKRSQRLCAQIDEAINHAPNHTISFSKYMEMVLYAPELGYYSHGPFYFGAAGDFYTAPEISSLFANSLAEQCREILACFENASIIEIGAGSGILAAQLLTHLANLKQLPQEYLIIEPFLAQQEVQRLTLQKMCPEYMKNVRWLSKPECSPINGLILANEVLDALPVNCFAIRQGVYYDRQVVKTSKGYAYQDFLANDVPKELQFLLIDKMLTEAYCSEYHVSITAFISQLNKLLSSGLILLCDYGYSRHEYYHPERAQGTLTCYGMHQRHYDPFLHPGIFDITAHVDFTHVAEAADACGLTISGFTSQSAFLLNCGVLTEIANAKDAFARTKQQAAMRLLLSPQEMGESIKLIALTKLFSKPLLGFSKYNSVIKL